MGTPFYNQFLDKWFAHNSFAQVVEIRLYAFHREIESAVPMIPDSKTHK